jgi:hypothetical protein
MATWRILFLIEGLPSFVLAICIFFFLPSRPDKSNFFTEEERTFWHTRLNSESLGEGHTGIDWRGVKRALTDPKVHRSVFFIVKIVLIRFAELHHRGDVQWHEPDPRQVRFFFSWLQ